MTTRDASTPGTPTLGQDCPGGPGGPGGPGEHGGPTRTGREILVRLLELTPPPPQHAEIAQLLATFEAIINERATIIAAIVPPIELTEADRALLLELEYRQTAWQDALTAAQRTVGEWRCGAGQLRAYARPL